MEGWAWSSSFGNGEEETHGCLESRRNWGEDAAKVGLGEGGAAVEKQSRARPPWSMFPGGCFGPGLLCHTHSLNSQNNHFK